MKNTFCQDIFQGYLFLQTSRKLISQCHPWRYELLIFLSCYQYAPPQHYEEKKKLKIEGVISRQYISKDKDQGLVEVRILIINMIQKLGYIFPFNFWIWIPLMAVTSDDFSGFWAFWGYFGLTTQLPRSVASEWLLLLCHFEIQK